MNEGTRQRLEEELKKMIKKSDQKNNKHEQPAIKTGSGNVIRRRAGENEKRFTI